MQLDPKHHYIPEFYLKQWCAPDGRLCEYSRPYNTVKPKRRYPSETGFERGLYKLPALPAEVVEIVERKLLHAVDDSACYALRLLLANNVAGLDSKIRSGWTRFIISLMRRNPEAVKTLGRGLRVRIAERDQTFTLLDDPANEVQFQSQFAILLQNLIGSRELGEHIINMRWGVLQLRNTQHLLLTSDRPLIMTNGMRYSHSHLAIPISPTQLFVATNTPEEEGRLQRMPAADLMRQCNDRMAAQARKFVYGVDDTQLRFVAKRFGQREVSFPGDT